MHPRKIQVAQNASATVFPVSRNRKLNNFSLKFISYLICYIAQSIITYAIKTQQAIASSIQKTGMLWHKKLNKQLKTTAPKSNKKLRPVTASIFNIIYLHLIYGAIPVSHSYSYTHSSQQ